MMNNYSFWVYLAVMAGITYLIRMLPIVLIKKRIKNRFLLSFLYYIPYAVLSVMTVPAIFHSTACLLSGIAGFAVAIFLSYKEKSLLKVAAISCLVVYLTELIINNFNI